MKPLSTIDRDTTSGADIPTEVCTVAITDLGAARH